MKKLFVLFLILLAFGTGYTVGSSGLKDVKKSYNALKEEMSVKIRGMEEEVSSMRVRMNLMEAKELLESARSDVKEKNFGRAEERVGKAKERLAKAISLSSDARKKSLAPV